MRVSVEPNLNHLTIDEFVSEPSIVPSSSWAEWANRLR